jgi:hypothetical protein
MGHELAVATLLAASAAFAPGRAVRADEPVNQLTNQNRGSFFDLEAAIGKVAEDVLDAGEAR